MQHQFKVGDLALIVGARKVTENIGKVCELVEFLEVDQISEWHTPGNDRPIHNLGPVSAWIVIGDDLVSFAGNAGYVAVRESHLIPLKGDQSPTQTNTETPKEVVHG